MDAEEIRLSPFRALRYNEARVGAPGEVWAPPYDVIAPEAAEELRAKHPHNIVRITLPQGTSEERYASAAATLEEWVADGVLIRDERPSLYVHRHSFELRGERRVRTGVWCLVRLFPFDEGIVLPHEHTMRGPKVDRLALMKACRAHLSPIFFICSDPGGALQRALSECAAGEPLERAEFPARETHDIWRVSEPEALERISTAVSGSLFLIADGHHRYETALAYYEQLTAAGAPASGRGSHRFVLAYVVPEGDPGLSLEPTHRVIAAGRREDWVSAIAELGGRFAVCRLVEAEVRDPGRLLEAAAGAARFILVVRGVEGGWLVEARDGMTQIPSVALHEFLAAVPGQPGLEVETGLGFARDPAEALAAVREGSAQAAALLAPSSVAQIREAARAGRRLPPKTTYFQPKVPTGVAIHRIDPGEEIALPRRG